MFNVREPATTTFPTLFNPCNSEVITVTQGVGHLHLEITASSNGGFHADINGNLEDVKGTGSLGNSYTVTDLVPREHEQLLELGIRVQRR